MDDLSKLVATTADLADELASLAHQIGKNIEEACLKMTETQKQEGRSIQTLRAISHDLQTVIEKARQYTEKIRDLSRYTNHEARMEKIYQGLQCQQPKL